MKKWIYTRATSSSISEGVPTGSATEVEFIRQLIASNREDSRRRLSLKLCEAWQTGQRRAERLVCRELLLELERAVQLVLPAVHHVHRNSPARLTVTAAETILASLDTTQLDVPLGMIRPLEFRQVRRGPEEPLF